MGQSALWGRSRDLEAIRTASPGVVVIAGDSGIGKTSVLLSLEQEWSGDVIVSEVSRLQSLDGAIQRAIARGLGDCIRQHRSANPLDSELWTRLSEISRNAVDAGAREAGRIFVQAAFGLIESKLGSDATQVIRASLTESFQSASTGFESQLDRLVTPDIVTELVRLASEIQKWIGVPLVVRVDSGERLTENDAAFVAELVSIEVAAPIYIVFCVSDTATKGRNLLQQLRERDAQVVRLGPLTRPSIEEWLRDANVEPGHWDTVERVSSGYPLFIQTAVSLLCEGTSLENLKSGERFDALLEAAWRNLPLELQSIASRLVVYADAPDQGFILDYLDCDALTFGGWQRQLLEAHIFVEPVSGPPWFHDRRRAHIWGHILTKAERAALGAAALTKIEGWVEGHRTIPSWIVTSVPNIIREMPSIDLHPYLQNLLAIGNDELALLWAMVEVIDPKATFGFFADTSEIVRWASIRAKDLNDPLRALEELRNRQMTGGDANEHLSLTGMVIPTPLCMAAVFGEIERRFAVRPLQHVASWAFDAFLRTPVSPFSAARISSSKLDLGDHRTAMSEIGKNEDPVRFVSDMFGLALNFSVEGLPISATVNFDSRELRDRARSALKDLDGRSMFELESAFDLPPRRVRWRRLVDVLRSLDSRAPITITSSERLVELIDSRARAKEVIRELTPVHEAEPLGMASSFRYLVQIEESLSHWIEFEVSGAQAAGACELHRDSSLGRLHRDPLRDLRLQHAGVLASDEHVDRWSTRFSRDQEIAPPLVGLAKEIQDRGRKYNNGLPRVVVESAGLEELIKGELRIQRLLSERLSEYGSAVERDGVDTSLVVELEPRAIPGVEGTRWYAEAFTIQDDRGEVTVRYRESSDTSDDARDMVQRARERGVPNPDFVSNAQHGEAANVLASLLGFDPEDVQLNISASDQ